MSLYSPPKFRLFGNTSTLLRGVSYLLRHWFLLFILVVMVSPTSPYVLVWYSYTSTNGKPTVYDCTYIGGRGVETNTHFGSCPFINIINHDE